MRRAAARDLTSAMASSVGSGFRPESSARMLLGASVRPAGGSRHVGDNNIARSARKRALQNALITRNKAQFCDGGDKCGEAI